MSIQIHGRSRLCWSPGFRDSPNERTSTQTYLFDMLNMWLRKPKAATGLVVKVYMRYNIISRGTVAP